MKLKASKTYAGTWIEIQEGFVESDFEVTNYHQDKIDSNSMDSWSKHITMGVRLIATVALRELLASVKSSYNWNHYVSELYRDAGYYKKDFIEFRNLKSTEVSYKGLRSDASRQKRFDAALASLEAVYDREALIKTELTERNESLMQAVNENNKVVIEENLKACEHSSWVEFTDEAGNLDELRNEVEGLRATLKVKEELLRVKRNEALLESFYDEDWYSTSKDDGRTRLPAKVIEAWIEYLQAHKAFHPVGPFGRLKG